MNQSFMKTKPILRLVISMSLPMVISMAVNSLYNIIDSYFIAKISENAMTAISLVFPIQNIIYAITIGFAIGINAVISFFLGAQDTDKANRAASQGLILNFIHGLILTVCGIFIMPYFLKQFTNDDEIIQFGIRYSNIVFSFSIVIALALSFEKIFQSVGKMTVSMLSMLTGCIINIILDPIMISGKGFIPPMGIDGAALATGIGQSVTLIIYVLIYKLKPINISIKPQYLKPDKDTIKKLYLIGMPATLNLALPSLTISLLNGILASFSQSYVLVLGVYYKLQTFLYLTANGIVQGIRPIAGYNYGAKEYCRVNKIYITSLSITAIIMTLGTAVCLTVPEKLISIFTDNQETIFIGAAALRIISAGFIVSSISIISSGILEGLSKGFSSLVMSLMRYVIIIIPTAYILSSIIGVLGVWHAFWVTEILSAVISYLIYYKNIKRTV